MKTTDGLLWHRHVDQIHSCDTIPNEELNQAPPTVVINDDVQVYGPRSQSSNDQANMSFSEPSPDITERRYPSCDHLPPLLYNLNLEKEGCSVLTLGLYNALCCVLLFIINP